MSVEDLFPIDRIQHMPFLYYPNVNTDSDALTPESRRSFEESLSRVSRTNRKAVLYLHVPFCRNHCTFCFYNIEVVKRSSPVMRTYVEALRREIEHLAESDYVRGLSIEHVFIGGGTPSMLPDPLLHEVLTDLRRILDLSRVRDFTIEMHLDTMTRSNLEICKELGITRVSFGWQTSNSRLRKLLALLPSEDQLFWAKEQLEAVGFPLVWDLMYALPGQSDEEWHGDLMRSMELGAACIDIHRCDIVPPAPLYDLVRKGKLELPTQQGVLDQYRDAYRTLTSNDYAFQTFGLFNRLDVPEGISHYAHGHYSSSHDLVALGPGAIGIVADHAYMNSRDLTEYADRTRSAGIAASCVCAVTDETWQERDFVVRLGQLWSVPKKLLRVPLSAQQEHLLERFIEHGVMEETPEEYRLTETAIGYHFSIASQFVPPTQRSRNISYLRSIHSEIGSNSKKGSVPRPSPNA